MSRNNYHTHTVYCDGKDTPEELVLYAIKHGCDEIGFSGHSFNDFYDADPFCMTPEKTAEYCAEIRRLKEAYRDRINILCGIERDIYSDVDTSEYDYVIGSVHYVLKDGVHIPVDWKREAVDAAVQEHYGGDIYAYIEDYYEIEGNVYDVTKCGIIGHFDLVTKFNEGNAMFDTGHPRYIAAADRALEKLLKEDVIFEVNYGAVARGYRSTPYPDERIIEKIKAAGKRIIFSSDCHDRQYLLLGIPEENRL